MHLLNLKDVDETVPKDEKLMVDIMISEIDEKSQKLIFLGDARSYHVTDWYHQVKLLAPHLNVELFSDLFDNKEYSDYRESNKKSKNDPLITIDKILFTSNYRITARFRNISKLLLAPLQAFRLSRYARRQEADLLFHAHSFYYILICYLARIKFVATPMGSDYLVRPNESYFYRILAKNSIKRAAAVTCDSIELQRVLNSWGVRSQIIQNGINFSLFQVGRISEKKGIMSVRGFQELYNIKEIMQSRNLSTATSDIGIEFVFPFGDEKYISDCTSLLNDNDLVTGPVDRKTLYEKLRLCKIVVSVPTSDASPRSVYEAIISGCIVITTKLPWIEMLTQSMRSRLVLVDLEREDWFENALKEAELISEILFTPSELEKQEFDTEAQMKLLIQNVYHALI